LFVVHPVIKQNKITTKLSSEVLRHRSPPSRCVACENAPCELRLKVLTARQEAIPQELPIGIFVDGGFDRTVFPIPALRGAVAASVFQVQECLRRSQSYSEAERRQSVSEGLEDVSEQDGLHRSTLHHGSSGGASPLHQRKRQREVVA